MPISKINTTSITDNSVTAGKIVAGAVDADIAAGSIDTAQIADDAVTSAKLDTDIDIAGNLGVGVVPESGWSNTWNVAQVGLTASLSGISSGSTGRTFITDNAYNNSNSQSAHWQYQIADQASQIAMLDGKVEFRTATAGSADADITWNTAVEVDNTGNVGVGVTPTDFQNRKSLDIGLGGKVWGLTTATETGHGNNFYFDGAYKRIAASAATRHIQDGNGHTFDVVASGNANSTISWNTAMVVDPTGNVGVGTTSPDTKVQIKGAVNSAQLILGGTDNRGLKISTFNQGGQNDGTAIYDAQDSESSAVNSHHVFKNGGTETLRIKGDGDLIWHDTPSSSAAGIAFTNITHPSLSISGGADTNYRHRIVFTNGNGTVGIISTSGSSTTYGTSSDYRLKENVDYTWDATTRLKQLKPARFNFIADPDTTVDGFLAHEAQSVVPESVTGTHNGIKDEEYEVTPAVLDDDGNITTEAVMGTRSVPDIQGIDQSKLVPLLVKTIQELEARITALEDA